MPAADDRDSCAPLLSLAVHELRTPAGVVHGYLHMLQQMAAGTLDDRQRHMVQEAERSCSRLIAVVAEMGEFARLEAGTTTFAREDLDVFALVESVAVNMQEGAERGIRFAATGDEAGARLQGDPGRLTDALATVFRALLRERAQAVPVVADRRILTCDGRRSALVVVAAAADAAGLPAAARGPFDERRNGLGFALVIASRVIAAHGGRLRSASGQPHGGAAVIEFPLAD